jgi:hypothetical protein
MSWLFCPSCPIPYVLSHLICMVFLSWLAYLFCPIPAALLQQPCQQLFFNTCLVFAVMFPIGPVQASLVYRGWPIRFTCPGCPILVVLSQMSYPDCLATTFLSSITTNNPSSCPAHVIPQLWRHFFVDYQPEPGGEEVCSQRGLAANWNGGLAAKWILITIWECVVRLAGDEQSEMAWSTVGKCISVEPRNKTGLQKGNVKIWVRSHWVPFVLLVFKIWNWAKSRQTFRCVVLNIPALALTTVNPFKCSKFGFSILG